MDNLSHFESRPGVVAASAGEVFNFVTDIRNFEQFIQKNTINDWRAMRESCSFNVSMIGSVSINLSEKEYNKKVVYKGDAINKNDFYLELTISDNLNDNAGVRISLDADLNPVLKMMAAKPISQFLEMVISQMEGFRGWKNIK
jgi:hypothetical protein